VFESCEPMSEGSLTDHQRLIAAECDALKAMLLEKNRNYGSSALDPVRIFSKADPVEQILVRIDDKLSRIARGQAGGEDAEWDATGYLILLRVARKLQGEKR
jgi:hypothetical protein